jgi:hypothetical protein
VVAKKSKAMYDGDESNGTRHHPWVSPRESSAQKPKATMTADPTRAPTKRRPVGRVKYTMATKATK